jgi:hypothetical protein
LLTSHSAKTDTEAKLKALLSAFDHISGEPRTIAELSSSKVFLKVSLFHISAHAPALSSPLLHVPNSDMIMNPCLQGKVAELEAKLAAQNPDGQSVISLVTSLSKLQKV